MTATCISPRRATPATSCPSAVTMSLARSAARSASRLSASRPALARRCFATAPSLDETYGATATVVPPAEEVAEL